MCLRVFGTLKPGHFLKADEGHDTNGFKRENLNTLGSFSVLICHLSLLDRKSEIHVLFSRQTN